MNYYSSKITDYYSQIRKDLLPYIPKIKDSRFLDIGCGAGNTLCYLKEAHLISEAVGVDFINLPNSNQQNSLIDTFIVADVQQQQLSLPEDYFDIILCADVLEHLQDPWLSLRYLKKFLKPGGQMIISIPNIREFRPMFNIIFEGNFKYAQSGILDKTHLRFFCKKNIIELVNSANLIIEKTAPTFKTCPTQKRRKIFSNFTFGIFDQFLAQQYIVIARKKQHEK